MKTFQKYRKSFLIVVAALACGAATNTIATEPDVLQGLIVRGLEIKPEPATEAGYVAAAESYEQLLSELADIDYESLGLDNQVDYDLFKAHANTRIFEYTDMQLFKVSPVSYISLSATNRLFLRPEANSVSAAREAVDELNQLPERFAEARQNLTNPARTWTENAIYNCYYARLMLREFAPDVIIPDAAIKREFIKAARNALRAVKDYEDWLNSDLLPRSTRSPSWTIAQIDAYQIGKEMLDDYPAIEMLRIAEEDAVTTRGEMLELAKKIHSSGNLRTVWEAMKDEAPPWDSVLPMAQSFVDITTSWLKNEGNHVVTIPDYIDYGARISPPMSRRILSFGGATRGPSLAGRQSGYYILTPLEERLSVEEKASRIRSYNPYWTHVISYHEWLGHNVQIAAATENVTRPIRSAYNSIYLSQAWSFYLEKLLPDEGYYADTLDYVTALKTHMGRLQMRMWRVQRIITKIKMAKGEMTLEEAVQVYVDEIGMEPTNAFIEVQRDSQSPSPPGREIIGERAILELREEYARRMGTHYSMKRFHDTLLTYGPIPIKQIRRLMFEQ
jgi:hypothetical protein